MHKPRKVRFRPGHPMWVFSLISQTLCCRFGLLLYTDGGWNFDCCCTTCCTWSDIAVFSLLSLLQGLAWLCKIERRSSNQPWFVSHYCTCWDDRMRRLDDTYRSVGSNQSRSEERRSSLHSETARVRELRDPPLYRGLYSTSYWCPHMPPHNSCCLTEDWVPKETDW